jgi:hypothetical protein
VVSLGRNVKLTVPRSAQDRVRALFDALGATLVTPAPGMDAFKMTGGSAGVVYVADGDALTPEQMRIAPWLELAVDDVERALARLDALGFARIDYHDRDHAYFAGPGGFVFRVAPG